jgi:hypothetical protein
MRTSNVAAAEQGSTACECWIYTPGEGLRHAIVENADTELTLGGERLRSWCILDPTSTGPALVVIYSVEMPTREVRRTATRLSRECFRTRPSLSFVR